LPERLLEPDVNPQAAMAAPLHGRHHFAGRCCDGEWRAQRAAGPVTLPLRPQQNDRYGIAVRARREAAGR
jgi:hypothetical protein